MGILRWLFGGKQKPERAAGDGGPEAEVQRIIERSFAEHLSRMQAQHRGHRAYSFMKPRWDKLLRPEVMAFAVAAADQQMRQSVAEDAHHHQGRHFGDLYVAVSTVPAVDIAQARRYFPGGYFEFMDVLLNEAQFGDGQVDLAHWIFCYDGRRQAMHLTYMPAMGLVHDHGPRTLSVLAQDLMTASEKAQARIG